jgi:hypothetical protein
VRHLVMGAAVRRRLAIETERHNHGGAEMHSHIDGAVMRAAMRGSSIASSGSLLPNISQDCGTG